MLIDGPGGDWTRDVEAVIPSEERVRNLLALRR